MQNDAKKVLLTFRNYNTNLLWRLFRDVHQSLRGASEEDNKEARSLLICITSMMLLHAGINVSGANRKMSVAANISDVNKVVGDIYLAEIFHDCVAGGGKPATDALLRTNGRIIGPAAVASVHPCKVGATLFT